MTTLQDEINELISALHQQRAVTYVQVATCTLVSYDILLTFSQELKVIWKGRPTLAKACYIIARYYTLAMLIYNVAVITNRAELSDSSAVNSCRAWINLAGTGPIIVAFTVDILLMMRVYVLYNQNKILIVIVFVLYLAGLATSTAFAAISIHAISILPKPALARYPGCITTHPGQILDKSTASWSVTLTSQTVMFGLILYKYILSIRTFALVGDEKDKESGVFKSLFRGRKLVPLLSLFVRDGSFTFLVMVAVVMVNLIFSADDTLNGGPIQQMGTPWLFAAEAVLASRLVLNLGGYVGGTPVVVSSSNRPPASHGRDNSIALTTLQFGTRDDRLGQARSMATMSFPVDTESETYASHQGSAKQIGSNSWTGQA